MTDQPERRLDVAELERLLREANPAVLLVPPRLLRRFIKHDRRVSGLGLQVPHRKTFVTDRDRLLALLSREELGLPPDQRLPRTVILITRPDAGQLADLPRGQVLVKYWRLLFHGRIHVAFERLLAEGRLTPAAIAERIGCIGATEFAEIRAVLRQEKFLLPPEDEVSVFVEFAAVYLELRHFTPELLRDFFPALDDPARIDALLAADVDAARLLAETRPAGTPDPQPLSPSGSERAYRGLIKGAERAAAAGNVVRAAVLRERAANVAAPDRAAAVRATARADLERLADRLRAALEGAEADAARWRAALLPLLSQAADELWPVEARLLYDLQQVCLDAEQDVYAIDVVEWALSLGRRPVKRLLPGQREVRMLKHLRSAERRLAEARLGHAERCQLRELLTAAVHHAEERLRSRFRPLIAEALVGVGLGPANVPERVALNKLVEELLDRVTERGFLSMGDLRDAVSRNDLKLPDLSGPGELILGDRLIRANRRLAVALDGVYRRGEFYLRWLQRLSSLAFGNVVGRILVLYLLLPFGGAFLALEGVQHIVEPVAKLVAPHEQPEVLEPAEADAPDDFDSDFLFGPPTPPPEPHIHLATPVTVGVLGLFLLALLHVPSLRRFVLTALVLTGRGVRAALIDMPARFLALPPVRAVLTSGPFRFALNFVLKPGLFAGLVCIALLIASVDRHTVLVVSLGLYLAAAALLNSRLGRDAQEALVDWLARTWERLSVDFLPNLLRAVLDFFRWLLGGLDRALYAVDEWLRFRTGQGRLAFAAKAVLGVVWFFVAYVVRAYVNLLIEPQTNPVKHFPVVTVSAKLLAPLTVTLIKLQLPFLEAVLSPKLAGVIAFLNVSMLPGVFGFLAWELKENWRLYAANRPADLRPVPVGHHGETVGRLLRPGLHSGTVPKLFRRLRRAERRAPRTGDWAPAFRQRAALHHVAEAVRHLVERDFVELLAQSRGWSGRPLEVAEVRLASNRIRVELACEALPGGLVRLDFEERDGRLVASLPEVGGLPLLPEEARNVFAAGLVGLFKKAGVQEVRGPAGEIRLEAEAVSWQRWVEAWQADREGKAAGEFLPRAALFPCPAAAGLSGSV